jgi:8-oxo-dGTP diphosphatase
VSAPDEPPDEPPREPPALELTPPEAASLALFRGFEPHDRATLLFVIRGGEVLLIKKKRGLGRGKVNGPGGRIEPGESAREAALRETLEEVCVRPSAPRELGALAFRFVDGYSLYVRVFRADGCEGEPRETAEAEPFWAPVDAVPFDAMWADDRHWFPYLLAERPFFGRFVLDGDRLVVGELGEVDDPLAPSLVTEGAPGLTRLG